MTSAGSHDQASSAENDRSPLKGRPQEQTEPLRRKKPCGLRFQPSVRFQSQKVEKYYAPAVSTPYTEFLAREVRFHRFACYVQIAQNAEH
jgi:hypothetical protein